MGRRVKTRKIMVEVPEQLLDRATKAGERISDVVRGALELRANQHAWQRLSRWSGKVKWTTTLEDLRKD